MQIRGAYLILGVAGLIGLFMAGVWFASQGIRQDYHVLSPGDTERPDLDVSGDYAVWLEQHGEYGAVVSYSFAKKARVVLEPRNATLDQPIVTWGSYAAWVEGAGTGARRVVLHDLPANTSRFLGDPGDNFTLPGRTLEGDRLVLGGTHAGRSGAWIASVSSGALAPLDLHAPATLPQGPGADWWTAQPRSALRLSGSVVWWFHNDRVESFDLDQGRPRPSLSAAGRVLSLDADRDLVAWTEDHGRIRRVAYANAGNGSRGEVSNFPSDQHDPAVNGSRVIFIQADKLVRFKDLATGEEKILPARTDENIHLRLNAQVALWLSGTIQGHNVFEAPLHAGETAR